MLDSVPSHDYDYSETTLYRIFIALENSDFAKASEVLEKDGRKIVDLVSKKEYAAQIQQGLGKTKAAELAYQGLLDDNPDNKQYLASYLLTKDIDLSRQPGFKHFNQPFLTCFIYSNSRRFDTSSCY